MFLADMVVRISQYVFELFHRKGPGVPEKVEDLIAGLKIVPYQEALNVIDKGLSERFMGIWKSFTKYYTQSHEEHEEIVKRIKERESQIMRGR